MIYNVKLESLRKASDGFNYFMRVKFTPTRFGRLLRRKEQSNVYYGSGTIWHEVDIENNHLTRVRGMLLEDLLIDMWRSGRAAEDIKKEFGE